MIYSVRPYPTVSHVNTKIMFHGYEISVASDDSCGTMDHLKRTDIRIFKGDEDVTGQFADSSTVLWSAEDLFEVMKKIVEKS